MTLASLFDKVMGFELVQSAIDDAKKNATRNGLGTKCEYFVGPAEKTLKDFVASGAAKGKDVVAVVDPPRPGLHPDVLKVCLP